MPEETNKPATTPKSSAKKSRTLDRIVLVFDDAKHTQLHAAITKAAADDDRDPNELLVRYLAKQFKADSNTFTVA